MEHSIINREQLQRILIDKILGSETGDLVDQFNIDVGDLVDQFNIYVGDLVDQFNIYVGELVETHIRIKIAQMSDAEILNTFREF